MTDSEMIMPFVLCASNGGPFDDMAFIVGWDCATLYAELRQCHLLRAVPVPRWVKGPILPQLDLIAMETGFLITHGYAPPTDGTGLEDWVWVMFAWNPNPCACEDPHE